MQINVQAPQIRVEAILRRPSRTAGVARVAGVGLHFQTTNRDMSEHGLIIAFDAAPRQKCGTTARSSLE
jgi:hypothetical protein